MSVLLCYDGSPSAQAAISLAGKILARDRVTVLHVWAPPAGTLADSLSDAGRYASEAAQKTIAEGQARAGMAGLDAECRLEPTRLSIWRTILRVARETDARVIVMGTRGHVPVQQSLVGSVSRAVVLHAPIPVLVIPSPVDRGELGPDRGHVRNAPSGRERRAM
jgi:nucleotide-binding universal stress UspA family protein